MVPTFTITRCLAALACSTLVAACGAEPSPTPTPSDASALVGRWAGTTLVGDLVFAPGRDVRFDEIFELRADGTMRGDFAGLDDESGCVAWYALAGTYEVAEASLVVSWSSIRARVLGCQDSSFDHPAREVDAEEHALWDAELDGTWSVSADTLSVGDLVYRRAQDPLIARWHGTTEVDDFEFAPGRTVVLDEDFWINVDGTMEGFFRGVDPTSGCTIDYRLRGAWSASADTVDVEWHEVSSEVYGCAGSSDAPRAEITPEEYEIWDAEFDGEWLATDTTLTISHADGTLEYSRGL